MNAKQKDVVLIRYPFSDGTEYKVRPALIVSSNKLNKTSKDCILVPLTAVIKEEPFSILVDQKNLSSGKLIRPSRIRVDKIFSMNQSLIFSKIGELNKTSFKIVKKKIFDSLD